VKVPTLRDISIYRRTVVSAIDLPHNQEELRFRIEPAVDLYKLVAVAADGYADAIELSGVPPNHMSAVVVELIQAMDDLDPAFDPNP
jgi:hypothetical protein